MYNCNRTLRKPIQTLQVLHLLHMCLRDHYDLHLYLRDRNTQSSKLKLCIRSLGIFFIQIM